MRFPILVAVIMLGMASCGKAPTNSEIRVEGAWIQLPAVSGRPGAAYFTIRAGQKADELTGVSTPAAGRAELHSNIMDGGMMRMGPLKDRSIPANGALTFAPGGNHVMLFNIRPDAKAGAKTPITFTFKQASPVTAQAEIRAFGADHGGH
jgi:hypothetical protein